MRNKAGMICMILGTALILGALSLYLHNQHEASQAAAQAETLLPQLFSEITRRIEAAEQEGEVPTGQPNIPEELLEPEDLEMPQVEIDGHNYIGCVSIPRLGIELPVMADWSYAQLKIAPCRYAGTLRGDDLVLMAHNYIRHFGPIRRLRAGDSVMFTDVDGIVTRYEVVGLEILEPKSVEVVTAGDFDLTLFTCTYGGKTRVTVYCDRVKNG